MKQLVESQRAFFNPNATKGVDFRRAQLENLRTVIENNEARLEQAIVAHYVKGRFDTFITELYVVYEEIADATDRWG
jgi:aldehyde dehydrogenase (NAD+)